MTPTVNDLFDQMTDRRLQNVFDLMDVAESMIERYQKRHPSKKAELFDAFKTVMPTHNMSQLDPKLFSAHCEELLTRVVAGEDVTKATSAEVVCAFSVVSQAAPIHGNAAYAYFVAFTEVFGEPEWAGELRENYDGAHEYWLHEVRLKARDKNRHKPDPQRWYKLQAEKAEARQMTLEEAV